MSNLQNNYYTFKLNFQISKNGPTHRMQIVNPLHQTPPGHLIAKLENPL